MRLYKYLSPKRTNVLINKSLAFSKPTSFNDPFDCSPHFQESDELNPLGARTYFLRMESEGVWPSGFDEEILDHVRRSKAADPSYTFHGVVQMGPEILEENHGDLVGGFRSYLAPRMQDSVIVLSLTEDVNNLLMWAHYAADHTGFVLGFCSKHPFFSSAGTNPSNPGFLNKVVYSDNRPSGIVGALSAESAYLTKGREWSYEKEWRVLQECGNATNVTAEGIHLFAFPPDAVTEVVIGARATPQIKDHIKAILSDKATWPNTTLLQASVDPRHYRLNYDPVPI